MKETIADVSNATPSSERIMGKRGLKGDKGRN